MPMLSASVAKQSTGRYADGISRSHLRECARGPARVTSHDIIMYARSALVRKCMGPRSPENSLCFGGSSWCGPCDVRAHS